MMGGDGSGNFRPPLKDLVESCWELSIGDLVRDGMIQPWHTVGAALVKDHRTGNSVRRAHCEVDAAEEKDRGLTIFCTVPFVARQLSIEERIGLTASWPHFGGQRWWFSCPNRPCGKRVGKVYLLPGVSTRFACRACHRLVYKSSQQAHRNEKLLAYLARFPRPEVELCRLATGGEPRVFVSKSRGRRRRPRWMFPDRA